MSGEIVTLSGMELKELQELLERRRFQERMRRALLLVAKGETLRGAAAAVGLASHQDVAKAASDLGL